MPQLSEEEELPRGREDLSCDLDGGLGRRRKPMACVARAVSYLKAVICDCGFGTLGGEGRNGRASWLFLLSPPRIRGTEHSGENKGLVPDQILAKLCMHQGCIRCSECQ